MKSFWVHLPEKFDFSRQEEWPKWSARFERFRQVYCLAKGEEESQTAVKVQAKKTQKLKDETTEEESPTLPSSTRCERCGNPLNCKQANCPAKEATCYKCSKRSHCGTVCKSSKTVGEVQEDGNLFFGEIGIETNNTFWSVDLLSVNAQQVRLKIDTGADVTVILDKIYEALRPSPAHFSLSLRWCFGGKIQKRDKSTEREIFVVNGTRNTLSGRPAIEALAIVKQGWCRGSHRP